MSKRSAWIQVWLTQGKCCAKCGKEVALDDTAKHSHSFDILCIPCYNSSGISMVWIDEVSTIEETNLTSTEPELAEEWVCKCGNLTAYDPCYICGESRQSG